MVWGRMQSIANTFETAEWQEIRIFLASVCAILVKRTLVMWWDQVIDVCHGDALFLSQTGSFFYVFLIQIHAPVFSDNVPNIIVLLFKERILHINGTYHLQLHVVVPGIDGHTGRRWEDSIQERKVGQTGVVGTRAVHSNIQNIHHIFTDQRHHQAEERARKYIYETSLTPAVKVLLFIKIRLENNRTHSHTDKNPGNFYNYCII